MNKELKEQLLLFYQKCDSFKGKTVYIKEYISTHKDNFDRHFTTFSELKFKLNNFGVRLSGGRVFFMADEQMYEIGGDIIIAIKSKENNEFELMEKYSETVYRKSILKFE
ncbi:hypothetical protein [Aquimarina sp. MMG016]|uniref:hypothetical protein n=1 Tax=Aquimarina sp. MMG016 TaxID=2822690 RepID=UPI001B3A3082|nr:hypothetical protein [Aquimarina sp. MMG016]MBQ4822115.1 hypothetical protein [Aquimarina sp. MMG016]